MENATCDGVSVTPINTDETCSRIQIKINPSYELQSTAHDQGRINKKGNANNSQKNTDEIYLRLGTTQTNIKSSNEFQRRADIDQTSIRVVNQNIVKDSIKYNVMLITMIALLLTLTLVSIALSVATYSRSSSEQSKVQDQLNKTNNDMISVLKKLDTIESNNDISDQSNISQILNELDAKLQSFILLQTQYASAQTQTHCIVAEDCGIDLST